MNSSFIINHIKNVNFLIVMNNNMKIYIIWLIGVILWNFGYPSATPLMDVLAAIILSFISVGLKKYFKIN